MNVTGQQSPHLRRIVEATLGLCLAGITWAAPAPIRTITAEGEWVRGAPPTPVAAPGAPAGLDAAPPAMSPPPRMRPYGAQWVQPWRASTAGGLAPSWPRPAMTPATLMPVIESAGQSFGVDPALVASIIHAESAFQPTVVSPKGAQGLMQLMPATAARFGVADPFDPAQNIRGGTAYLAWLMQRFGGDTRLAVAAYNAGERAVARWGGIPPYQETQRYVQRVLAYYNPGNTVAASTARRRYRNHRGGERLASAWRIIDASGEHVLD